MGIVFDVVLIKYKLYRSWWVESTSISLAGEDVFAVVGVHEVVDKRGMDV